MRMNRKLCIAIITSVALVGVFIACRVGLKCRRLDNCDSPTCQSHCDLYPSVRGAWNLPDTDTLVYVPTTAESNELVAAFAGIDEAYASGQVELVRQRASQIPNCVTNIADHLFLAMTHSYESRFSREFLDDGQVADYSDVKKLSRYLQLNIEVARLMGCLRVRRKGYSGCLRILDSRVLERLYCYRDKYIQEGRLDMQCCVMQHVNEWIDQIESEDGFTRRYMLFQLSLQYPRVVKGDWSYEYLLTTMRQEAGSLLKLGYTPKWLKEFYVGDKGEAAGSVDTRQK